jgi:tetratricopeptide (TPR) repeat protein
VRAGYALFAATLILIASGVVLTRLDFFEVLDPDVRGAAYWVHVAAPFAVAWLFVLHRLAGRRIRWKVGLAWSGVAAVLALSMLLLHSQDPRRWNVAGPASGLQYFFPSLARTSTGNFIPADTLMMNEYCLNCHADIHETWSHSAHRFSSFNNPAYLFSVKETREVALARDGSVQASRFCAGCHDPVPFFSGAFDDPEFDLENHPTAKSGITCTSCHSITNVNSNQGNAAYTIEEPTHYPFARSANPLLSWINQQLVKAKPAFHKKTFLKPLHKSPEFCGACHKVHLPEELNDYKWLRGQNHYDTYHLSGVSGHGVQSFYYPPKAKHNCQDCHMELVASDDFGARYRDDSGELKVHDHLFPSANTALPHLLGEPPEVIEAHRRFNAGVMRVDVFGIKEHGAIDGALSAPLRPQVPELEPGRSYLIESVIRTVKMGHLFTQGTADSNEVWLDVTVTSGGRVIGRSGGMAADGEVDPWSHYVNVYMLDREGRRIDRRNAQDIFVALYNHQIPPGAGEVVHYRLDLPEDVAEPVTVEVKLRYRKFDTTYVRKFQGEAFDGNDLPILELASDRVTFPVRGAAAPAQPDSPIPAWERWNDYGIGLLRKSADGARGELRQAEAAFREVEALGRPDGPLNLARVYIQEGRLDEAVDALARAGAHDPPAPQWSVAYFTGIVNKQRGFLDAAIEDFRSVIELDTEETRRREFDFSQDYTLLNELGQTLFERAKLERGDDGRSKREALLAEAVAWFEKTLAIDPENLAAHYNLAQVHALLGDGAKADEHRALHARYKPDDNARDRAIARARIDNPAANHAAEAVVIYDLRRPGAYGLFAAARESGDE